MSFFPTIQNISMFCKFTKSKQYFINGGNTWVSSPNFKLVISVVFVQTKSPLNSVVSNKVSYSSLMVIKEILILLI